MNKIYIYLFLVCGIFSCDDNITPDMGNINVTRVFYHGNEGSVLEVYEKDTLSTIGDAYIFENDTMQFVMQFTSADTDIERIRYTGERPILIDTILPSPLQIDSDGYVTPQGRKSVILNFDFPVGECTGDSNELVSLSFECTTTNGQTSSKTCHVLIYKTPNYRLVKSKVGMKYNTYQGYSIVQDSMYLSDDLAGNEEHIDFFWTYRQQLSSPDNPGLDGDFSFPFADLDAAKLNMTKLELVDINFGKIMDDDILNFEFSETVPNVKVRTNDVIAIETVSGCKGFMEVNRNWASNFQFTIKYLELSE